MRREANIEDWRVFCAIAKTGSIHAAADLLGSVDSLVSRTLTGLEKSLGCQLINRDKRPFSLTASGEIAQLHGQRLVEEYDHLVEELQSAPHQLAGPLRVGIPPGVLDGFLIEHLANFHRDYPDIELSVVDWHSPMPISFDSPNGRLDIVSAYGPDPASPEIVQIQYGTGLVLPCASPLYLARHHYPQSPDDVRDLTGIVFYSPLRPMISSLQRNGVKKTLPWGRRMIFYSAQTAKVRNQSRHPHFTLRAGIKKRKFGAGNAWLDFGSVEALPLHAARIAAAASGAGFRPLVLPSHAGNPQQDGQ